MEAWPLSLVPETVRKCRLSSDFVVETTLTPEKHAVFAHGK